MESEVYMRETTTDGKYVWNPATEEEGFTKKQSFQEAYECGKLRVGEAIDDIVFYSRTWKGGGEVITEAVDGVPPRRRKTHDISGNITGNGDCGRHI